MASTIETKINRISNNIAATYAAVEEMGGIVPEAANSDNLPNAVRSIPASGVTVQNKSGSFTTNSSGKATVNCGFKPDYVIIRSQRTDTPENVYSATAHFAYNPDGIGTFGLIFYELSDDVFLYGIDVTQTNTGFSVVAEIAGLNLAYRTAANVTFNYYAVKYE